MAHRLPPPDPHEPQGHSDGYEMPAPTAVFAVGSPSAEVDRIADAILNFRPGALIVLVRE